MKKPGKLSPMFKKYPLLMISGLSGIMVGILFLFRSLNEFLIGLLSDWLNYALKTYWVDRLQYLGLFLLIIGLSLIGLVFLLDRNKNLSENISKKIGDSIKLLRCRLGKHFNLEVPNEIEQERKKLDRVNYWDFGIVVIFLLIACLFFYNPCQNQNKFIELGGDAATYTTGVAALDHPELFTNDVLYGEMKNFEIYLGFHILLIRLLFFFTNNYGYSFQILILPHVFFHLLGFYILGKLLLKNRFWAFFLSIIISIPISLNQERWGVWLPLPRFLFQTFLPFLLYYAMKWKNEPRKWHYLMILTALSVYLHSFSGLIWGFCFFLGFVAFLPEEWSRLKKITMLLGQGFLFMVLITPYAINFLPGHQYGSSIDYDFVIYVLKNFFPNNIFNVGEVLISFVKMTLMNGIFIFALMSIFISFILFSKEIKEQIRLILIWSAGILFVSILIPFVERLVEKIFRLIPFEVVLTRGIRFIYPLMLLVIVITFSNLYLRSRGKNIKNLIIIFGLVLISIYSFLERNILIYEWQKIKPFNTDSSSDCRDIENKSQAIKSIEIMTPPGSKILSYTWDGVETVEFYEIRYAALRPLVFNFKDSGQFAYRDYDKLKSWYQTYWELKKITENFGLPCERLSELIKLKSNLNADFLFVNSKGNPINNCNNGSRAIFNVGEYYLFQ